MTQVIVEDPIVVEDKKVDTSGRISIGRDYAGQEVEVIISDADENSDAENVADTPEEATAE